MKLRSFLASLCLLPSLASAITCGVYPTAQYPIFILLNTGADSGACSGFTSSTSPYYAQPIPMGTSDFCMYPNQGYYQYNNLHYMTGSTTNCTNTRVKYYPITGTCSGTIDNNICHATCASGTVWQASSASCVSLDTALTAYNNNADGCHSAGGLLWSDGTCMTLSNFGSHLLAAPTTILGGGLFVNGLLFTSAGLVGASLGAGMAGSAFAAVGTYAMLAGAGTALFGLASPVESNIADTPKQDVQLGSDRLKVNLDTQTGATIAKTDLTTGKVSNITNVPPTVLNNISSAPVSRTDGSSTLTPSSFAGTKSTDYNYQTNTATTTTVQADGSKTTETTPIQTVANSNGTTTTIAQDNTIAPTVTGTTSSPSADPSWSPYAAISQWSASGGGTGSSSINTNTGGGSSGGTVSGSQATNTTSENTYNGLQLDDGSSQFSRLTDGATNSYSDYKISNPLGMQCSSNIDPIRFYLKGHLYTIMDSVYLSSLPVDLIRNIFLFVAAVAGLIFTLGGGM